MTGMALDDFFSEQSFPGSREVRTAGPCGTSPRRVGAPRGSSAFFCFVTHFTFFFKQPEHPNPNVLMSDGRFQGLCFAIYLTHRERVVTLLLPGWSLRRLVASVVKRIILLSSKLYFGGIIMYSNSRHVVTYKILTVKTDFLKWAFLRLHLKTNVH